MSKTTSGLQIEFNDTDNQIIDDCNKLILELIIEAGKLVNIGFAETTKTVSTKTATWDVVTEYDKNCEALLINGIRAKYPDHQFIAEESEAENQLTDVATWVIDPIDGTNNFIHGIPFIGISVAMILKKHTVIGVVYNPVTGELYRSRLGNGTYLNDHKIECSKVETLDGAVYAHEVSFARVERVREKNINRIYKFSSLASGVRSFGCAALTLAYVARGIIDGYQVDDLKPWDVAAGALLIQEAGGSVYHSNGNKFNFMDPNMVCAGTEQLCQELIDGIKESNQWELKIENKIN